MIIEKTAKISKKGQITLPKTVRDKLQSDTIRIVIDGDLIRLEPVHDVGGSLKRYATRRIDHRKARDQAWGEALDEKHLRR